MKRLACVVLILILCASTVTAAERVVVASPAAGGVLVVKEPAFAAKVGRALLAAVIPGTRRDEVVFIESEAELSVGPGRVVIVRRSAGPSWIPSVDVRVERERLPRTEQPEASQCPGGACVPPQVQAMPIVPPPPQASVQTEPIWRRIASAVLLVEAIVAVLLFVLLMIRTLRRPRLQPEPPEVPDYKEPVAEAE